MATIYKRKNSDKWYAAYFDAAGKRVYRSTGCKLKRDAEATVADWEREERKAKAAANSLRPEIAEIVTRAAREANSGSLTIDKARGYITKLYRMSSGDAYPTYSVGEWLDQWLENVTPHIGTKTIARYSNSIADVKSALGHSSRKALELLTTEDVQSVQAKLKKKGGKASTVNFKIQDFKSAIRSAHEQGIIERNIGRPIRALATDDSAIRVTFEPLEVETLMAHAKPDWKGAILIGAHTGLRLSNITELVWRDVNLARGVFTLKPVKQKKGQRKVVTIPMSPSVLEYLNGRDGAKRGPVFPALAGRSSATHSTAFANLMKRASVSQEVELEGGDTGRRSFHSLRHFFVTTLTNANVPEDVRQSLAAHQSKDVHRIYSAHDTETLMGAIETLPSLRVLESA